MQNSGLFYKKENRNGINENNEGFLCTKISNKVLGGKR